VGTQRHLEVVRINPDVLTRKLHVRGKSWSDLRAGGVSYDTLAKIKRGEPVATRIVQKITVQLVEWPELEHAADLLTVEPTKE
jgi:hypothetical protein